MEGILKDPPPVTLKNKKKFVSSLMKLSVVRDDYLVTLEGCELFKEDISRFEHLDFFADLLHDLNRSVALFEMKLRIIWKVLAYLKREQIESLIEVLSGIIDKGGHESIYAKNLNPVRCGFLLIQIIESIQINKGFSEYTCTNLKN